MQGDGKMVRVWVGTRNEWGRLSKPLERNHISSNRGEFEKKGK